MPRKLTIEHAHRVAEEKGGKCLSDTYTNAHTKMDWECKYKHIWYAIYSNVKQGAWCPECNSNKKKSINDCHLLAESRGGVCLSKIYKNNHTKLQWECHNNHRWRSTYAHIKRGTWCPHCNVFDINNANNLAKFRGGYCLSDIYVSVQAPMMWGCCFGHEWSATYNSIQQGRWCPKCFASGRSKNQIKLVGILSNMLNEKPEINYRPNWLKNPKTNRNLEIDMYFPNIRLAVEYNGRQHYEPIDFSGKCSADETEKEFMQLKYRDALKKRLIRKSSFVDNYIVFTYRNAIEKPNVVKILHNRGLI